MKYSYEIYKLIVASLVSMHFLGLTWARKVKIGPCIWVIEESGDCPDPDYIKTYLFTRKNEDIGQYIITNETSDNITSSHFNPLHTNRLIIHGFDADMNLFALTNIKKEYLRQEESNVWMVNYPRLVENALCYPFAVHNIQHVGHCLAQFVMALRRHKSNKIHIVGFSLGAHVTNFIANKLGDDKIPRISGLDPAGPLFMGRSIKYRLDPSDAVFVDVLHTNGLIQGYLPECGHIDFYMNGGVNQPGCLEESHPIACNHHRAPEYFAESINTKVGFLGWQCDDYAQYLSGECKPKTQLVAMGEKCSSGNKGFYIVYTAAESPFALGNWSKDGFWKRVPKMSFNKSSQFIINGQNNSQHIELLQRVFPEVF